MHLKTMYIAMLLGAAFTAMMTLIFYFTDLDLVITASFYAGSNQFPVGGTMPWAFFNEKDDIVLYIMVGIILFLFIIGLCNKYFRPFLVYGLFMLVSYLVGPGLIVNVLLKGNDDLGFYIGWSRPRPDQLSIFGGPIPRFYRIWEPAFLDGYQLTNSSFPSGHVTVGAMFIVIFLAFNNVDFIARIFGEKTRTKIVIINAIKYAGLVAAIVLSIIFSISRISAGRHFASDCMYAVFFTWLPAVVLYYWVFKIPRLEQRALDRMKTVATNQPK
ncbi:MAG: phosphatase PAP2 family protein [Candidatus Sigynarchaeota archaeon]